MPVGGGRRFRSRVREERRASGTFDCDFDVVVKEEEGRREILDKEL